jgi:NADPH:quinone reductase-like Zn-dependent oxidoreductase
VQAARIERGETALITGAAGAVGSAACQIALQRGARVLGVVKQRIEIDGVELIESDQDIAAKVRELTGGRGADVCLDTVSGPVFPAAVASLATGGRLAVIVAKGDGKVTLDLRDLYRRKLQLLGVNSLLVNTQETAGIYRELRPLFEAGNLQSAEPKQISFDQVHSVFETMEQGSIPKTVLVP